MLKKFKIFFLLLCTASGAIAQGNNPALGQVTYAFRTAYIKTDSGIVAPTSYQVANYRLLFGQNSSLYSLISRPVNTVNFTSGIDTAELFKNKGARDLVYKEISKVVPSNAKGRETNYLKKYGSRLLTRQEIGTTNEKYLILDTVPEINWQVSEETKVILSYSCQKAVGSFRGRNYTAWFTTQIPLQTGPWKLGGLPGLILAASDDKKEIFFEATKIEIPATGFEIPENLTGDTVTASKFVELNTSNLTKNKEKHDAMMKAAGHTVITKSGGRSVLIELNKN